MQLTMTSTLLHCSRVLLLQCSNGIMQIHRATPNYLFDCLVLMVEVSFRLCQATWARLGSCT